MENTDSMKYIVTKEENVNGIKVLDVSSIDGGIAENLVFAITCDCVEPY